MVFISPNVDEIAEATKKCEIEHPSTALLKAGEIMFTTTKINAFI